MSIAGGPGGNRPGGGDDFAGSITTVNLMRDLRYQPTLREQLSLGVGKAHRNVTYSHYEYRNTNRSSLGTTGRVR
jgi:hypothetical protein